MIRSFLARDLLGWLGARREQMLDELATLVGLESPSNDVAALGRAAEWLEGWLAPVGTVVRHEAPDGRVHLLVDTPGARAGGPLLMTHYDTVWPLGTTAGWPFARDGELARGPGVFDMKAGIVGARYALLALHELGLPCRARLLLSADEETGSLTCRDLIDAQARWAGAALVLEPPLDDGRLKTARKGRGEARLVVTGRAAHAGIAPEAGVSAIEEIARIVPQIREIAAALPGTSATVGSIAGGGALNVVPERAEIAIDLRAWTGAAMEELQARLRTLAPQHPDTRVEVEAWTERPPLERSDATGVLFERARAVAATLGLELHEGRSGGCSEGNMVGAHGVRVLDGLGVRGAGAHMRDEHIRLDHVVPQAALVAALVTDLSRD